jgi:hypothetical protein
MNQVPKYKLLISESKRVSRIDVVPYGVYKISTYKTAKDAWKVLRGQDETLIFVTGIYENKVNALKLSVIDSTVFFEWFKRFVSNTSILENDIITNVPLYALASPMDVTGKRIYDGYIRDNALIKRLDNPYRVYNLHGIQYIQEVTFKKEVLKRYYG